MYRGTRRPRKTPSGIVERYMLPSEMIASMLSKQGADVTVIREDGDITVMNVAVPGWGDMEVSVLD